jgi:hypothetical protein
MDNIVHTWEEIELTEAEFNRLTEVEFELTDVQLGAICGGMGTVMGDIFGNIVYIPATVNGSGIAINSSGHVSGTFNVTTNGNVVVS